MLVLEVGPCALVAGFSKETRNTVTDNVLRRHAKTVSARNAIGCPNGCRMYRLPQNLMYNHSHPFAA